MVIMAFIIYSGTSLFISKAMTKLTRQSFESETKTRMVSLQKEMRNYLSQRVDVLQDFSQLESFTLGVLQPDLHGERALVLLNSLRFFGKEYSSFLLDFEGEIIGSTQLASINLRLSDSMREVLQGQKSESMGPVGVKNDRYIRLMVPVKHQKTIEGALVVDVPLQEIYTELSYLLGENESFDLYHNQQHLSLLGAGMRGEYITKVELGDGFWGEFSVDKNALISMTDDVHQQLFLVLAGLVLSVCFLAFLIFNQVLFKPLERLKNYVKALQEKPGLTCDLSRSANELILLKVEFDQLIESLEQRRMETETVNAEMDELVLVRTRELARKVEELENLNHHRTRFIANMSKEILSPLKKIRAYGGLLKDASLSTEEASYTNEINNACEQLFVLTDNVLTYSKVDEPNVNLTQRIFDFNAMLKSTYQIYLKVCKDKKISFKMNYVPNALTWVQGDENRLRQVLMNLISNAIKFTHNGEVNVSISSEVETKSLKLRVKIKDSGTGLTEQEQVELFNVSSNLSMADHSGFGVEISRDILRKMGSELMVLSTKGQGSCFYFDLSLVRVQESVLSSNANYDFCELGFVPRILVLDEHQINLDLVKHCFADEAVDCEVFSDAQSILALLKDESADLILMDCGSAKMNGFEATQKLRDLGVRIPILALTENVSQLEIEKCYHCGMDDYITKPIEKNILLEKAHYWLKSSAEQKLRMK